jgi:murein DD-endopeptidase MepM/ murein hydrolase activator NlpD
LLQLRGPGPQNRRAILIQRTRRGAARGDHAIDELIVTHAFTARRHAQPHSVLRFAQLMLTRLALAGLAFAFVNLGGADLALRALASAGGPSPKPSAEATALTQPPPMIWTIDTNGDGLADFSNPTNGGMRGIDAFGSGDFGARRDAGKRRHHGVDYVAAVGAAVRAPISGKVTRLGYAYRGVGGLRVVEITNPETRFSARVLYVAPTVAEGDVVVAGDQIGAAQDLSARYPGITNHVHVELRDAEHRLIDAAEQLPSTTQQAQRIAFRASSPS